MRVIIAEDQALLREGLARLFADAGHEVTATIGSGDRITGAVSEHSPDLAVLDVRMPPTHTDEGLKGANWIRQNHPEVSVLLLSQHVETEGAVDLVGSGNFGYLLKDRVLDVDEFMSAAERVAAGGSALDPKVVAALVGSNGSGPLANLTGRELEVLALVAEGLNNRAIAESLHLTERTVESHVRNIFSRLDLPEGDGGHRRVLAVLEFLRAQY